MNTPIYGAFVLWHLYSPVHIGFRRYINNIMSGERRYHKVVDANGEYLVTTIKRTSAVANRRGEMGKE